LNKNVGGGGRNENCVFEGTMAAGGGGREGEGCLGGGGGGGWMSR